MENVARIVMLVYGLLMLGGGIGGYRIGHSKPSLIAGIASAVLMTAAYFVSRQQPKVGFGIGVVVALGLAIVFIRRIQETHKMMPSAGLCGLSLLVAVIFAVAIFQSRA